MGLPNAKVNVRMSATYLCGCGHTGGLREVPGLVVGLQFEALCRTWNVGPKLDDGAANCLQ